jgi:hypothetical protein
MACVRLPSIASSHSIKFTEKSKIAQIAQIVHTGGFAPLRELFSAGS